MANITPAYFVLDIDDPYVYDLVKEEIQHYAPKWALIEPQLITRTNLLSPDSKLTSKPIINPTSHLEENISITFDPREEIYNNKHKYQHTFYYTEYERIDWDELENNPHYTSSIWYTNRKGLIRKAELVNTIEKHLNCCHSLHKHSSNKSRFDLTHDTCEELLDDENWYYFSDIESDTDDDDDDDDDDDKPDEKDVKTSDNEDNFDQNNDDEEDQSDESDEENSEKKDYTPHVFKFHEDCCPLQSHVPQSIHFTLYSLHEIDELLQSDLPEILALDQYSEAENFNTGNIWILKPSMTNQAKGIHIIASTKSFRLVFENHNYTEEEQGDILSIRDWVIQKYIHPPFLFNGRKFHLRVYVYATGNLNIYIFDRFLALFSLKKYQTVDSNGNIDPSIHITNTCYQKRVHLPADENDIFDEEKCVMLFHEVIEQWSLQYLIIMRDYLKASGYNTQIESLSEVDKRSKQIRQLRAMLRHVKGLFYSPKLQSGALNNNDDDDKNHDDDDDDDVDVDDVDDDGDKNDNQNDEICDNIGNPNHSNLTSSFSPFMFFFKRIIRHFQTQPNTKSTNHPSTNISLLFDSITGEFDINSAAKQLAIQFYFHILGQIRIILQELFLACIQTKNVNRLDYQPQLAYGQNSLNIRYTNVIDIFKYSTIIDDRLNQDELLEKNQIYFQPSGIDFIDPQITKVPELLHYPRSLNNKYVPIGNSSELYGFDFILDHRCKVYLLEANPGPDFGQTGQRLKSIVCQPLIRGVISIMLQQKRQFVIQSLLTSVVARDSTDIEYDLRLRLAQQHIDLFEELTPLMKRDTPLIVQHEAAIMDCKEESINHSNNGGNCPTTGDKPIFINHRQETQIDDYIGTDGTTWLEDMPNAPHFLPILSIPL